mmetsp:Transcript_74652/g.210894  ORF Transcript_74652/g.210894 Transcript_74652/m.210894 type:complete len:86 (+) Transcript_74652:88-345(+)
MQQPGERLAELAQASSVGAMWARLRTRSKGLGMPLAPEPTPVQMEMIGNTKLTIYNAKMFWWDTVLFLGPIASFGIMYVMHKIPK